MAGTVKVTDSSFEADVLKSDIPVVVDFWAEWCGPCRMIGPALEEIAGQMEGKVKIAKLNVDENQQIASKFGIMSIPALLVFKNGDRLQGTLEGIATGAPIRWRANGGKLAVEIQPGNVLGVQLAPKAEAAEAHSGVLARFRNGDGIAYLPVGSRLGWGMDALHAAVRHLATRLALDLATVGRGDASLVVMVGPGGVPEDRVVVGPGLPAEADGIAGKVEEARETARRLTLASSVALALVVILLFLALGRWSEVAVVLGTLPIYVTGSSFIITPVVALVRPDCVLKPNPYEVADLFEVPLAFLLDPANHRRHVFDRDGIRREWFSMPYQDGSKTHYIWGATAGMLRNFYRFMQA